MILLMKGAHMYTALALLIIAGLYCLILIVQTYDKLHTLNRLPPRTRLRRRATINQVEHTLWVGIVTLASIASVMVILILFMRITP